MKVSKEGFRKVLKKRKLETWYDFGKRIDIHIINDCVS